MEIRARYVVIGAFVLAFVAGVFGFVYWIKNIGGLGQQAVYQIRFEQPVSGLTAGSGVLFNGIRVGTITNLALDPQHPKRVTVSIAVDPATPIRSDTQVDVTFQGLTGAPAIALKGGEAGSPAPPRPDHQPPLLVAGPGVGQTLTESARDTLHRIDDLVSDNSKDLHTAITGISTFADMLGRNSKRIEGLIAGLEKLAGTGEQKKPPSVYDLAAASDFPAAEKTIKKQVVVPDPSSILAFDTQKILIRTAAGTFSSVEDGQWADNLPKLMQARIVQSFENAHQLRAVSRPIDQMAEAYRLELGIRNFQISPEPTPTAVVEFSARLLDDKGNVVGARLFNVSLSAKSAQAADAVAALDKAFSQAEQQLVVWTIDQMQNVRERDPGEQPVRSEAR